MASAPIDPVLRAWRYRIFAATWLSYFGLYFCRRPFYVAKSTLTEELHWTAQELGTIGAAYLIAYAIGQFLAGALGTRRGPRIVVLVGMGTSLLIGVAFGITNSLATFTGLMIMNGFAQASGWSNNVGIMGNWFRREERGTVMGFWATNFQVGGIVAPNLASFVLAEYGYQWAFFSGSMVLALIWIFFFFFQRNRPEDVGLPPVEASKEEEKQSEIQEPQASEKPAKSGWGREVWTNVILIGVFYFFLKLIRYAVWSWAPYMLSTYYNLKKNDSGYLSTLFDLAGFAGVLTAGYLSDKLFKGRRATISALLTTGLVVSCVILYLGGQSSLMLFTISLVAIGFMLFGPDALMTGAGAVDVGGAKHATLAAGIISGLGSAGPVVQELWLGSLLDSGRIDVVFMILLGSAILALISILWIVYRNKTGKADL